ncbi:hypothetical protein ACFPZK_14130 [Psychrobacter urativorans]|nr:hypothetical protein [Psychrobacter urativorans]
MVNAYTAATPASYFYYGERQRQPLSADDFSTATMPPQTEALQRG